MYVPASPGMDPRILLRRPVTGRLPFPFCAPRQARFWMARGGIYHLMHALGLGERDIVLMPDYHSGTEVWAVRAAGAAVRFYHIDRKLGLDLEELRRLCREGARVLYLIHYFGWPQPVGEVRALCRDYGLILIEDCALSLLSELDGQPLGSFGHHAVFCLYKTLPVPDGGLMVRNDTASGDLAGIALKRCDPISVAGRSAEVTAEWVRGRLPRVGKVMAATKRGVGWTLSRLGVERLPVGDITPDFQSAGYDVSRLDTALSPLSGRLLRRFDYPAVLRRRRENFALLRSRLAGRVSTLERDLFEGVCPLFFPLLVHDKSAAAKALRRRGVAAVELWNYGYPEAQKDTGEHAAYLRRHLLELPIHQDLTVAQVNHLADQVLALRLLPPN